MIPVVINNRNRLTMLRQLVDWLLPTASRVYILDNDSTYPPLLEYYEETSATVIKLGANIGHLALYKWGGHFDFSDRYFVYTDPDILPREDCPADLLTYLVDAKRRHPSVNKIGLALEVRDLPDHYRHKHEVIKWEQKFWRKRRGNFFAADVDTTFAIYDLQHKASRVPCLHNCLRTDYPYVGRHLPWYIDSANPSEEEVYYVQHATAQLTPTERVGMWTQKDRRHFLKML